MGLAGYYWKFIKKFSRIACPMNSLEKKENNFLWTTKCEESFQNLKHIFTTTPILQIADPDGDFIICRDASKEGLRGVLLQNDYVICYESRKLKEHEKNYPTHDLELASINHTLNMWRHYLMGRKFLLKIENMIMKNYSNNRI